MNKIQYIACRECDLLHRRVALPTKSVAYCSRCHAVLYTHRKDRSDQAIAFALAGVVLYLIANSFPVLSIAVQGNTSQVTLLSSAAELYVERRPIVAMTVLFTAVIAPAVQLLGALYVLVPAKFGWTPAHLREILRLMSVVRPWNMISIFLLAALVSLTKLTAMADVIIGTGLWAMVGLIMMLSAVDATFDPEPIWERIPPVTA